MRLTHAHSGLTLLESLVAIGLLGFILLCTHGVLQAGQTITSNDTVLVEMQQQARNGLSRLVREVREATTHSITALSASNHRITFSTPTLSNVKYYLSGTNLVREYPNGTVKNIASNIGLLNFSASSALLNMSIRADKPYYQRTVSFAMAAKVRMRNQ